MTLTDGTTLLQRIVNRIDAGARRLAENVTARRAFFMRVIISSLIMSIGEGLLNRYYADEPWINALWFVMSVSTVGLQIVAALVLEYRYHFVERIPSPALVFPAVVVMIGHGYLFTTIDAWGPKILHGFFAAGTLALLVYLVEEIRHPDTNDSNPADTEA